MKSFVHGGNIYKEKPASGEWLDYSANINPLGLSPRVKDAIATGISGLVNYPEPDGAGLKAALSKKYAVSEDNIVLGNGAAELFYLFMHAYKPKRVLLPVPSFSEYERASLAVEAEIHYFQLKEDNNFAIDEKELLAQLQDNDCLFLGNPNNPTGNIYSREFIAGIVKEARLKNVMVVVDESFLEFLPDDSKNTVRDLVREYDKLFVIQSLTKFFAIPGLRLGLGFMQAAGIEKMNLQHDPWNVNYLAQQAGIAALADEAYRNESQSYIMKEKEYLANALRNISGFKVFEPSVNYIFIQLGEAWGTSSDLAAKLKLKGILIRDCSNYPGLGKNYIRVAVKLRKDNERLISILQELQGDI